MRTTAAMAGVAVAATGLSLGILGTGLAGAASKPVLSDSVTFTGTLKQGPAPGSFVLTSTRCSLKSDAETASFPCKLNGTVVIPSTGGSPTGNATLTSSDGKTTWSFTLTPVTGTTSFKMKGTGKESDRPDPGGPPPKPYSATMTGTVTPNFSTGTASGSVAVYETSTAP